MNRNTNATVDVAGKIMRQFRNTEWGAWGYQHGLIKVMPCGNKSHRDEQNKPAPRYKSAKRVAWERPKCALCDSWYKQARDISIAHSKRHHLPSLTSPKSTEVSSRTLNEVKTNTQQFSTTAYKLDRVINIDPALKGYVYIATNPAYSGWIKIGSAVNLAQRLSSYQTSDPLRRFEFNFHIEVDDRVAVEKWCQHSLSHSYSRQGEWLQCSLEEGIAATREALAILQIDAVSEQIFF